MKKFNISLPAWSFQATNLRMKFSIEIENFKRATQQGPFLRGIVQVGIEFFNRDWINSVHTRRIVKTSGFTRGVCKNRDFIKFTGFLVEFLESMRSWENQKPPENRPEKWTCLSLSFCNAPSLHTVDWNFQSRLKFSSVWIENFTRSLEIDCFQSLGPLGSSGPWSFLTKEIPWCFECFQLFFSFFLYF